MWQCLVHLYDLCTKRVRSSSRVQIHHEGVDIATDDLYADPQSIFKLLRSSADGSPPPVRALKGSWLLQRAAQIRAATSDAEREQLALPRRQVLEMDEIEAFYTAEQVEALPRGTDYGHFKNMLHFVSISHCWLTSEHPDPRGDTLLMIADALLRAQEQHVHRSDGSHYALLPREVAVFYDWCSLCQKDEAGNRTPTEQASFTAALSCMQIWYAHQSTTVFLMTKLPKGALVHAYDSRGWPTFERLVSMLVKPARLEMWPRIVDAGSGVGDCTRLPPVTVDAFETLLRTKHFTNGADRGMVVDLYRQTAYSVLAGAWQLDYIGLGWGDDEVIGLCHWLPRCQRLKKIFLRNNPLIGDRGIQEIVDVVKGGSLRQLEQLILACDPDLGPTQVGASGMHALQQVISSGALPSLQRISLTVSFSAMEKEHTMKQNVKSMKHVCSARSIQCKIILLCVTGSQAKRIDP